MEEIIIYKFQLEEIINALQMTSNLNKCENKISCYDRVVVQAKEYAKNALKGKKDERVKYM